MLETLERNGDLDLSPSRLLDLIAAFAWRGYIPRSGKRDLTRLREVRFASALCDSIDGLRAGKIGTRVRVCVSTVLRQKRIK